MSCSGILLVRAHVETTQFVIEGHTHRVVFHSPVLNEAGWTDHYVVRLEGPGFSAETIIECDYLNRDLVAFFQDLENHWKGWKGEKKWRAFSDELEIVATMDLQGHVLLGFSTGTPNFNENWKGEVTVSIYAGRLQSLPVELADFFGRE